MSGWLYRWEGWGLICAADLSERERLREDIVYQRDYLVVVRVWGRSGLLGILGQVYECREDKGGDDAFVRLLRVAYSKNSARLPRAVCGERSERLCLPLRPLLAVGVAGSIRCAEAAACVMAEMCGDSVVRGVLVSSGVGVR